jgi:hypothetical protein
MVARTKGPSIKLIVRRRETEANDLEHAGHFLQNCIGPIVDNNEHAISATILSILAIILSNNNYNSAFVVELFLGQSSMKH